MTPRLWCCAVAAALVIGVVTGRVISHAQEPAPLPAERVTGIGGVFFEAKNPQGLRRWYREHLGVDFLGTQPTFKWREHDDPSKVATTVWAIFPDTTR